MAQKGFIVKIFFFKDEEFLGQLVPEKITELLLWICFKKSGLI